MKIEGYKPSPQEMTTAENMMTTEQRLASELRETFINETFSPQKELLNNKRKQ